MRILKFSTPTCTYCKVTSPHVDRYAKSRNLEVIEVNADSDSNSEDDKVLTAKHEVMSVPVVVFEDQEKGIQKLTGMNEIMEFITQ